MVKSYGNYLPAGFTNISGSDVDAAANCDTSKGDVCPDVTVDTSAKDSKWSWKDLKNTVKSGINAAKTAYDTYKTVKNTVETTVDQAKKIGTAIKNSEGGLTGVLDTLGEVATASNTIFNTVQTGAGAVVANTSSIANDVQNAGKSGAELAFDKENQNRINELEKKLAAGNLSPEQQEWAKAELEQRKAAVDSNKVTDFANNQGQKALDKINSVAKTGSTVAEPQRAIRWERFSALRPLREKVSERLKTTSRRKLTRRMPKQRNKPTRKRQPRDRKKFAKTMRLIRRANSGIIRIMPA